MSWPWEVSDGLVNCQEHMNWGSSRSLIKFVPCEENWGVHVKKGSEAGQ